MHELSIAEALLGSLKEWHEKNGGEITKMSIAVGRLAGVDPEALRFAWPMALAAGAAPGYQHCALEIEMLPLAFRCRGCDKRVEAEKLILTCPFCGREALVRDGGRELTLKHLEVE